MTFGQTWVCAALARCSSTTAQLTHAAGAVNELFSRTFAVWTLTSCMLCLICARNPCNPAIYGARSAALGWAAGLCSSRPAEPAQPVVR